MTILSGPLSKNPSIYPNDYVALLIQNTYTEDFTVIKNSPKKVVFVLYYFWLQKICPSNRECLIKNI